MQNKREPSKSGLTASIYEQLLILIHFRTKVQTWEVNNLWDGFDFEFVSKDERIVIPIISFGTSLN